MKKGKKLLINIFLISIILLFLFYFGGYYISKDQCIKESLRGLYAKETEIIMELKRGNRYRILVADTDNKTHSIIGVKKLGFLLILQWQHLCQRLILRSTLLHTHIFLSVSFLFLSAIRQVRHPLPPLPVILCLSSAQFFPLLSYRLSVSLT